MYHKFLFFFPYALYLGEREGERMRTQQVFIEPVIKQAKRDVEKISEKRALLFTEYQDLRKLYFGLVGGEEVVPIIQRLDDLYKKPTLSKRDLIILDNYQNLFEYDEVWERAREKYVKAQDVEIANEKALLPLQKEVRPFILLDGLVEKRNRFSFADNRIQFWIKQISLLLKHFVNERELYQNCSSLFKRYLSLSAKKQVPLAENWRQLTQEFLNLQKQVLEDAKGGREPSEKYMERKRWVMTKMESLDKKIGTPPVRIEIDDTVSEEESK